MLPSTRTWVSRFLGHPHTLSLACGAAAGTAWIAACAAYWTAFETVPAARITFAIAWALTLSALLSPRVSGLLSRVPHFWRAGAASCGLALWPALWKALLARRELIPLDWYAGEWTALAAMAIPAALVIVPVVVLGCLLCPAPSVLRVNGPSRIPQLSFWIGVAVSWLVLPTTLFVRVNADQVLLSLSACLLLGAGLSLFLRGESGESSGAIPSNQPAVERPTHVLAIVSTGWWPFILSLLGALLVGFSLEAANRTAEQLVLESLPLKFFGWAGFVVGVVACLGWGKTDSDQRRGHQRALLVTAFAAAWTLVLFPLWLRIGIWSSASLSSMPAIVLGKGLILAGVLFPMGIAAGLVLRASASRGWLIACIGAGYVLNTVAIGSLVGTQLVVCSVAVGLGVILEWARIAQGLFHREGEATADNTDESSYVRQNVGESKGTLISNSASQDRLGVEQNSTPFGTCPPSGEGSYLSSRWVAMLSRRFILANVCVLVMAITCQGWLNPARSAGLLFSSEAFSAIQNGHDLNTVQRADRARCLRTIEGENGVLTVWRQRANQLIVRRNGLFSGQMSIDNTLGPQNFWSVMTGAVPLVLHPHADNVLCLGTPGLVEIETLLGFPVLSLTCVESDRETRSLIDYQADLSDSTSRLKDGRLEWINATPMQFAGSRASRTYDVIVCPEASAVPMRSQPRLTNEFHARIARHLSEGGIFCQRMNIVDFGSAPLVDTLRSLKSVFEQTCIVTSDGYEVLLIATNSSEPIFEPGIVARLDTPQVRNLCGTLGGDWSMMTQLACVTADKVEELLAGSPGLQNSCTNARFTMQLGAETLRWGAKWKEKQRLFGNRTNIVLKALRLEEEAELTIARRIQDAQERTRILSSHAEEEWSYRAALKDALKDRPRTTIQKVNNEIRQSLASDDQHRKDYLMALGQAVRHAVPPLAAIERLESFALPYDPLLTDFVHFEAAHLLGRAHGADPAREYRHWMYCIAYAPDADRSVRPVAAALDVLRRNSEIEPDAEWRWDQFSFLLDVMRTRWAGRWQAELPSKYEAADMQCSIESVTATLSAMDDLRPTAGIDRETWKVQRRIWEDSLVAPTHARQTNRETRNQMLETVRQELNRRNGEPAGSKSE